MVVVLLYSTFYFFILTFQCRPVSYFWTQFEGASGSCVPAKVIADTSYTHAAVSATADWTLGILPIFVVWNLKMNARTKISVALLLSLGAVYVPISSLLYYPFQFLAMATFSNTHAVAQRPQLFEFLISINCWLQRTFCTLPPTSPYGPQSNQASVSPALLSPAADL